MTQLQIRLFRDSFNTPWGFRLQGGKDLGQPLSVQRVFSNSPAEGELQRGDLIMAIGGRDGNELTHKQALDLIKHGGGQIILVIQRPAPGQVTSPVGFKPQRPRAPALQQPPPASAPISYGFQPKKVTLSNFGGGGPVFGSDYSSYRPSVTQPVHVHTGPKSPGFHNAEMLNKVQESLDTISLSPRTPEYGGYQAPAFPGSPTGGAQYIPTGVRLDMQREQEMRRKQQMRDNPPYVPTAVRIDQKMAAQGKSLSPRSPGQAAWSRQQQGGQDDQDSAPAWKSTLKPTSVKPWDADLDYVPGQHQAPQSSGYQPGWTAPAAAPYNPIPQAAGGDDGQDGGPKVVHLQYNSPMGLYSNQNIQETYAGQTKAMAEAGALSPGGSMPQNGAPGNRDWNQSAVYRMIHGNEPRPGPQQLPQYQQYRAAPAQLSPKPQVQAYSPQQQQSFAPSVDEFGTSDF